MSNYGRNFGFRLSPQRGQRSSRHYFGGATAIPIGAPVVIDPTTENDLGQTKVTLAPEGTTDPISGKHGIVLFEYAPNAFHNVDPNMSLYSDLSTVPVAGTHPGDWASSVQVVSGDTVKVWFRNTEDSTFLQSTSYSGRVMVAGQNIATPTLVAGDYLIPGAGDDTDGYWKEGGDDETAWLVVTRVDTVRNEVEARMLF